MFVLVSLEIPMDLPFFEDPDPPPLQEFLGPPLYDMTWSSDHGSELWQTLFIVWMSPEFHVGSWCMIPFVTAMGGRCLYYITLGTGVAHSMYIIRIRILYFL